MTVRQFLAMFTDEYYQSVNIYDSAENVSREVVHNKCYDEFDDDDYQYLDMNIESIDTLYEPTKVLTLNVDSDMYYLPFN